MLQVKLMIGCDARHTQALCFALTRSLICVNAIILLSAIAACGLSGVCNGGFLIGFVREQSAEFRQGLDCIDAIFACIRWLAVRAARNIFINATEATVSCWN